MIKNLVPRLAVITITFLLVGCYTTVQHEMKTSFNESEAAAVLGKGNATVSGQIFLRRNDGMVVRGAGSTVALYVATDYQREMLGKLRKNYPNKTEFTNIPAFFWRNRRVVEADADGDFSFTGIPDGDYIIHSSVVWYVGDVPQGGEVFAHVNVVGGRNVKVNVRKQIYEFPILAPVN